MFVHMCRGSSRANRRQGAASTTITITVAITVTIMSWLFRWVPTGVVLGTENSLRNTVSSAPAAGCIRCIECPAFSLGLAMKLWML
jgi:hypothetical protein